MRSFFILLGVLGAFLLPANLFNAEIEEAAHHAVAPTIVILDAGHGGRDEGAKVHSFFEKRITLMTVFATKKHLEKLGYKVILTRTRDIYLSLPRRVAIANKTKASLFVSVHYNAARNKNAKGVEIYFCPTKEPWRARASKRLAGCVLHHLVGQTEAFSRGVKEGNLLVIRETQMPAILVEGGFMTNMHERSLLKDKSYVDKIAQGIALGVDKYFKS